MPEFFVKVLRADGVEPERMPASSLVFGARVMRFITQFAIVFLNMSETITTELDYT